MMGYLCAFITESEMMKERERDACEFVTERERGDERRERAVNGSALKRQLSVSLGFSLGFYDVDSLVVAIFYPAQLCLSNCFVVCVRACCVVCAIPFPFSPPLFLFCCFLLLLPLLIFMHT